MNKKSGKGKKPQRSFRRVLKAILRPGGRPARWLIALGLLGLLALGSMGYLEIVRTMLDAPELTLEIEGFRLSPWSVLKVSLVLIAFFWLAAVVTDSVERYLRGLKSLKTSNRVLLSKILQIAVYVTVFFLAMDVLGVDLTALTIFSGAVGIGVGFGLQKIASNFISGLILIFEKSVEIDDLVELGDGVAGYIRRLGGRYTLIETFDGKEVMIPNEDFITSRVTNWTFSNLKGRIEIPIGVAYGSDYELAQQCILQAAKEHPDCAHDPEPTCYMRRFGDSSVDFILFFWVEDIRAGRYKPQSEVMMDITRRFRENGITIPFPQRDVHMIAQAPASPGTVNER